MAKIPTINIELQDLGEKIDINHIRELIQAEKTGRLVVLDEPMRPLVWGDKDHDTILCPRCLCDLMGGFEYAPSCETMMFQCPHCGQPIKSDKSIDMEQSEAEAALSNANKIPCKHGLSRHRNEIGEDEVYCELNAKWMNVSLGDCLGNCESEAALAPLHPHAEGGRTAVPAGDGCAGGAAAGDNY